MLKVGITGGMGSGKSTIARMFMVLGVPVYFADDAAKKIMVEDAGLRAQITAIFGEKAYNEEGLNRAHIAAAAFGNPALLQALNDAVHPVVIAHGKNWMDRQQAPYVLKEAALVFESDSYKLLDKVIGVYSPLELRLQRLAKRDGATREDLLARISKQMNEEEKMAKCDYVITNDEQHPIIPQVLQLHEELLQIALNRPVQ